MLSKLSLLITSTFFELQDLQRQDLLIHLPRYNLVCEKERIMPWPA